MRLLASRRPPSAPPPAARVGSQFLNFPNGFAGFSNLSTQPIPNPSQIDPKPIPEPTTVFQKPSKLELWAVPVVTFVAMGRLSVCHKFCYVSTTFSKCVVVPFPSLSGKNVARDGTKKQ